MVPFNVDIFKFDKVRTSPTKGNGFIQRIARHWYFLEVIEMEQKNGEKTNMRRLWQTILAEVQPH